MDLEAQAKNRKREEKMSLELIKYYTDIYINTDELAYTDTKTQTIKKIAVAGLIESGVEFTVNQGEIYISDEMEGFQLTDIYPYLTGEMKKKIIYAESVKMLPPIQNQAYESNYAANSMESYDSDYEADAYTPQMPVFNPAAEEVKKQAQMQETGNSNWESTTAEPVPDVPPQENVHQPQQPVSEQVSEQQYQQYQPVQSVQIEQSPQYNAYVQSYPENPQNQTYQSEQPIYPENDNADDFVIESAKNNNGLPENTQVSDAEQEILEIQASEMTYEDCTLAVYNTITGAKYRFGIKAYPLSNEPNTDEIIIRCNNLNKASNYTQTLHGDTVTFNTDENLTITASRSAKDNFEIDYQISGPEQYTFEKVNIKTGGQRGNLLIKDEDLILRIYPVNKSNTDKEKEPIIYYIYCEGTEITSSSKERQPFFVYRGAQYELMGKWNLDKFAGMAIPVNQ